MENEQHWSDADKELVARMEGDNPGYEYRVLRGSLHPPYLQRREKDGGEWEMSVLDITS